MTDEPQWEYRGERGGVREWRLSIPLLTRWRQYVYVRQTVEDGRTYYETTSGYVVDYNKMPAHAVMRAVKDDMRAIGLLKPPA